MSQSPNRSLPIVIIVSFAALLLAYITLLHPLFASIGDKNDEVRKLRDQTALLERIISNKQEKGQLPHELQNALPLWDNTEQLVMSLKKTGKATGVKLTSASFSILEGNQIQSLFGSEKAMFPAVQEVKSQVVVQGSYNQIRSWLVRIQQEERLIVVNTTRYSLAVSGTTSAEISFTSYFDPSYSYLLENPVYPTSAP